MAMYDLEKQVKAASRERVNGRDRFTTKAIFDRLRVTTTTGPSFVSGVMEGDDYWRFVGNGRRPGNPPPVESIKEWIQRAGLDLNAFVVAINIGKNGTKAFQRKDKNVFTETIDKWEKTLSDVDEVASQEMDDAIMEVVVAKLKNK